LGKQHLIATEKYGALVIEDIFFYPFGKGLQKKSCKHDGTLQNPAPLLSLMVRLSVL
jgi:hypothetical protein